MLSLIAYLLAHWVSRPETGGGLDWGEVCVRLLQTSAAARCLD
jgi:hypothetical protein